MLQAQATAVAHPMQALIKYHGLRDWGLRIPYHDSISVNMDALLTRTRVEFGDFSSDSISINGEEADSDTLERCLAIVNRVRQLAAIEARTKIVSENSGGTTGAKGLGFSSSGGAALAAASYKASRLDEWLGWDLQVISRLARRLAGSACRSVVGGYARWRAGVDDESSFAYRIAGRETLDLAVVAVPLSSAVKTEEAHRDAVSSPFFDARVRAAQSRVEEMEKAILAADLERVGELAEIDSLELQGVTMTGRGGLMLYRPESILVMSEVRRMREDGIPAYFSMQTGPSVYVNTYPEKAEVIRRRLAKRGLPTLVSRVGGEVRLVRD